MKAGYNRSGQAYRRERKGDSRDVQLLSLLVEKLPKGAEVLDAGCGSGYPVAQLLARQFEVTGIDFSETQLRLAKRTVARVTLIQGDISVLPFRDETFDAIVSYYAIIHVPRDQHRELLLDFRRVLRAGGLVLLCMGAGDLPSDIGEFHGSKMFWSHYDRPTNLSLLKETGFNVLFSELAMDPEYPPSAHLFVLGSKR